QERVARIILDEQDAQPFRAQTVAGVGARQGAYGQVRLGHPLIVDAFCGMAKRGGSVTRESRYASGWESALDFGPAAPATDRKHSGLALLTRSSAQATVFTTA